jgi:hypothetical protein
MPSRRAVLAVLGSVAGLGPVGVLDDTPAGDRDSRSETVGLASRSSRRWTDRFGTPDNDEPVDSVPTHEGGVVVLAGGGDAVRLVAYAPDGTRRWTTEITGDRRQIPTGVHRTDDGYLVAGATDSRRPWLLALDAAGDRRWRRSFRLALDWDRVQVEALCRRPGGGAVLGGYADTADGDRVWLLGTDAAGRREWLGSYGEVAWLTGVAPHPAGGYTVVGHVHVPTADAGSIVDALLLGTDEQGRERWRRTFGGNGQDRPTAVLSRSHGALIGGVTTSGVERAHGLLVAVDRRGRGIWSRSVAETGFGALVDRPLGALAVGDRTVFGVDRYGRTRWRLSADSDGLTTASVAGGTLVTAGRTDYLGQDTGSQVWVAGEPLQRA